MEKKDLLPTVINYDDPKVAMVLKNTVAKGATEEEFQMFVAFCKSTGLNPYKKEIWFIKDKTGRVQMMSGINGFYEIANRHPQFDGLECEAVEANGKLIKYVARCYRKDRSRPMVAEAYLSEYGKDYGNWRTMPRVMLSKCAEAMALRKSFPQDLNGLYTQEEMPKEFGQDAIDVTPKPAAKVTVLPKSLEQDKPAWMEDGSKADESNQAAAGEENQGPAPILYNLGEYATKHAAKWADVCCKLTAKGCTCMDMDKQIWSCPVPIPQFRGAEMDPAAYYTGEAA